MAVAGKPSGLLVFFFAPVDQSHHLPLTPFDRGQRFNRKEDHAMTTSTRTPKQSPATTTKRRTSRARPLAAVPVSPEIILSSDEIRLVMAHRNLKPSSQNTMLGAMESCAAEPSLARSKAPSLRLIAGGAA